MRRNKFGNIKQTIDGLKFDSRKEGMRYLELKLLQRAGEISDLTLQPRFEIIPKTDKFRAAFYAADFQYTENGITVVEDVKSPPTRKKQDYVLRKKLMYERHGIEVREV